MPAEGTKRDIAGAHGCASCKRDAAGRRLHQDRLVHAVDDPADEERAEPVEVERRLLRLAHRLDDGRERKQLLADQADDEVVVVAVEAVAGQADVVGVVGGAERHADGAVLGEDRALLFRPAAARSAPLRRSGYQTAHGQSGLSTVRRGRSISTSSQVRLVAERVGAAEHACSSA